MTTDCRRIACAVMLSLAALAGGPARAGGAGLAVDPTDGPWPRWSARVQFTGASSSEIRLSGARLLGDYYVDALRLGDAGGLRLTSGVFVGARAGLLESGVAAGWRPAVVPMTSTMHPAASARDPSIDNWAVWPYVGMGYSAASLRGGWGFSADLGLAAQRPGAVRLGRLLGGAQNLDDVLRDLRLQPLLQVGVSYEF